MKPKLLDLFCGAGGAGVGYARAGFEVIGVDVNPQPNYPFQFIQGDAVDYLALHGWMYDAIHASPPCQAHSKATRLAGKYAKKHSDFIAYTRFILQAIDVPHVIENVEGAPLINPLRLCGTQFGLKVYRHRYFESNRFLFEPEHYPHRDNMPHAGRGISAKGFITVTGDGGYGVGGSFEYAKQAMGIDWMKRKELSQAIPPAYTEYIGKQLIKAIG